MYKAIDGCFPVLSAPKDNKYKQEYHTVTVFLIRQNNYRRFSSGELIKRMKDLQMTDTVGMCWFDLELCKALNPGSVIQRAHYK